MGRAKIFIAAGIVAIGLSGGTIALHSNTNEYTVTVTGKEVKNTKETSKYLIFTEDKNGSPKVFEDTDSVVRMKFNSSDIYAQLEEGKTYEIDTYGFRIPPLSLYENIYDVKEVK
ncbi:DUF1523 family protein [Priestia aryabhattai]|uniref:DUF1523 family protein n=1 Tax=Priestia aryabhattai TaxID=412384 RepID=UPI00353207EB